MTLVSQFGSFSSSQEDPRNQTRRERALPNSAPSASDGIVEDVRSPVKFPTSERARKISIENRNHDDGAVETEPLKLLISDRTALDCELMLLGLRRRRDFIGSVMCATSSPEVERVARTQEPDVALVSAALSDGPLAGFRALPGLQSFLPECAVIVLLDDDNEELLIDAFRARARGVFHRVDPIEQLVKCIERVRLGEIWAGQKELRAVFDAFADSAPFSGPVSSTLDLNVRELMVARLVAKGQTNRQIGQRLHLSEHTVKNYLYRVFEKVGVRSRVELAVLMMNNNSLKDDTDG
jgi:DNA-binding NarL/FixJ family response regulator